MFAGEGVGAFGALSGAGMFAERFVDAAEQPSGAGAFHRGSGSEVEGGQGVGVVDGELEITDRPVVGGAVPEPVGPGGGVAGGAGAVEAGERGGDGGGGRRAGGMATRGRGTG